jgi:hypothetical protein
MSWQDLVNGAYEFGAGFAVLLHCVQLFKDKEVKGASALATSFFFSWGIWNLYYYPHLDQWASFYGGLSIVAANCAWLLMMLYYKRFPGGIVKAQYKEWRGRMGFSDHVDGDAHASAVKHWNIYGPCAPQCEAECDGACASELLTQRALEANHV